MGMGMYLNTHMPSINSDCAHVLGIPTSHCDDQQTAVVGGGGANGLTVLRRGHQHPSGGNEA